MIVGNNKRFIKTSFQDEDEIEKIVLENASLLFGPYAIIVPKQFIQTSGGYSTVPDGIVIEMNRREWFLLEVERATHGTWEHIAPQVSKQLIALKNDTTKRRIHDEALSIISKTDELKLSIINELKIQEIQISNIINDILRKQPIISIPIDGMPKDLQDWANSLSNKVVIPIIEKYVEIGTNDLLYSFPADNNEFESGKVQYPITQTVTTEVGIEPLEELIINRYIEENEELFMTYYSNQFKAKVQKDGLMLDDGRVYSVSGAAIVCIKRLNPSRETANGWITWKNAKGKTLNELYSEYSNHKSLK